MDQSEREAISRRNRERAKRRQREGREVIPGRNDPRLWKEKAEKEFPKPGITSKRG